MRVEITAGKESRKGNRGATVVEFAMVLPLFLLLLFGIIEFGRYFFVQHTVQFATREGTRLALVGGTLAGADGKPMTRTASIIKEIKDNASLAVNPAEISISIFPITAAYSDPAGWDGQQNAGEPGAYMRVRTRHTYRFFTPLIGNFFTGWASTIQAEATYRNEFF
jgi:Flp pilus assembly protein TadG